MVSSVVTELLKLVLMFLSLKTGFFAASLSFWNRRRGCSSSSRRRSIRLSEKSWWKGVQIYVDSNAPTITDEHGIIFPFIVVDIVFLECSWEDFPSRIFEADLVVLEVVATVLSGRFKRDAGRLGWGRLGSGFIGDVQGGKWKLMSTGIRRHSLSRWCFMDVKFKGLYCALLDDVWLCC